MRFRRIIGSLLVVALGAAAAILTVSNWSDAAQGKAPSPFANVPGLARDVDGAERDELIAIWEAFKREQHIQKCMSRSDFEYEINVQYPVDGLLTAAAALGVEASQLDSTDAERGARPFKDRAPKQRQASYAETLYGESYDDLVEFDNDGFTPAGRSDFAQGGCYGKAKLSTGSVFSVREAVHEKLIAEREQRPTDLVGVCGGNLADVTSMEDLEEASARGGDDLEACQQAANAIASEHALNAENAAFRGLQGLLRAHEARYNGVMNRIAHDKAFGEYLADAIAGLEPAPEGPVD